MSRGSGGGGGRGGKAAHASCMEGTRIGRGVRALTGTKRRAHGGKGGKEGEEEQNTSLVGLSRHTHARFFGRGERLPSRRPGPTSSTAAFSNSNETSPLSPLSFAIQPHEQAKDSLELAWCWHGWFISFVLAFFRLFLLSFSSFLLLLLLHYQCSVQLPACMKGWAK